MRAILLSCILTYLYVAFSFRMSLKLKGGWTNRGEQISDTGNTEQKKAPRPLKRICGQIVIHVFFSSFGVFCSFTDKRAANGGGMEELCTRAMKWNWQAEP